MTIEPVWVVPIIGLGIAGYGFVRWRLIQATQSYRLRAACEADELIHDERLGDEDRARLARRVTHAFNGWLPWFAVVVITPVTIYVFLKNPPLDHDTVDEELRGRVSTIISRMIAATMLTSPLASILTLLQVAVVSFFVILLRGSSSHLRRLGQQVSDLIAGRDGIFGTR